MGQKSQTTTWDVKKKLVNDGIFTISTGLPDFFHQQYVHIRECNFCLIFPRLQVFSLSKLGFTTKVRAFSTTTRGCACCVARIGFLGGFFLHHNCHTTPKFNKNPIRKRTEVYTHQKHSQSLYTKYRTGLHTKLSSPPKFTKMSVSKFGISFSRRLFTCSMLKLPGCNNWHTPPLQV